MPVPGKTQYFLNGGIEQYCGDNMQFDPVECTCIPISADIGVVSNEVFRNCDYYTTL
jgi:hypothetical protein